MEDWAKAELAEPIRRGQLTYYRADGFTRFRMAHAKNVAHRLATAEIVCNLDADNFLGAGFAEFLMETFSPEKRIFVRSPLRGGSGGRIAFWKRDFFALGGYDERMSSGWGFEDKDIIARACLAGARGVVIPKDREYLRVVNHSHRERTQFSRSSERSVSNHEHQSISRENILNQRNVANEGSGWGIAPLLKNFEPPPPAASLHEKLHVGCGRHRLLEWRNCDKDLDIRKLLPFGDESLRFIFAEHVVEHIAPAEALSFFEEVRRVLKAGGAARISVPCVDLISNRYDAEYAAFLKRKIGGAGSREDSIRSIILNWGHKSIWTVSALSAVLGSLGFHVEIAGPGFSRFAEMNGIDGHGRSIGVHANWVESGVVEAVK